MSEILKAPFPAFGGKRDVAELIWDRLGTPKQYIEPFCFSAAVLLAAPKPASLEVIGDANGFVANFWRAVRYQPGEVARWADYPVSHIDMGARHVWLMAQRDMLASSLQAHDWPGDAKAAGYWLWGQCAWIGSGWCDWWRDTPLTGTGQIPHLTSPGQGIHAIGQVPHVSDAGRGIQALGKIPHVSDAGITPPDDIITSSGRTAWVWLHKLAARLERVRVVHGEWFRCLNNHYGDTETAIFLDPPYKAFEVVYGGAEKRVADVVEDWARENSHLRVCIAGHVGDYNLPGWTEEPWTRKRLTYSGSGTTDKEVLLFSPACIRGKPKAKQALLFGGGK